MIDLIAYLQRTVVHSTRSASSFRYALVLMMLTTSVSYQRQAVMGRRFSTMCATPADIGKYIPVPYEDLLVDVVDRPVTIFRPKKLRNTYYGLRHGESEANLEGIISSDPVRGYSTHGLTAVGKVQSRRAATALIDVVGRENFLKGDCIFLSSDFRRARQTTEQTILALNHLLYFEEAPILEASPSFTTSKATKMGSVKSLGRLYSGQPHPAITINELLRERSFGQLDQQVLLWYNKVWPVDKVDAFNNRFGVESVQDVCKRVSIFVKEMEKTHKKKHIVMTSHADTLQIMQMFLSGTDPREFSSYRFKNGEVRNMEQVPPPVPMQYTKVNK